MNRRTLLPRLAGLMLAFAAVPAFAQNATDTQTGQVNTRVGGELYGNNSNRYSPNPWQTHLLPSEERYARFRSGMLPSELEMNRASIGPLTPNGGLDYINARSQVQREMNLPQPQLYNPAYDLSLQPNSKGGPSQAPKTGFDGTTPKPPKQEIQSAPLPPLVPAPAQPLPDNQLPTGQLPTGQLLSRPESLPPAHFIAQRTVRHGTLLLRHPQTQPTPPPEPQP